MAVTLIRAYQGFVAGATVTFPVEVEAAIVAQGIGTYAATSGVNPAAGPLPLNGAVTAGLYGPAVLSNIPMGAAALTGFETNGVAQTAFEVNLTEIFVPHWNTWTGAALLNGTTVGTDSQVYWLFNSNGYLIQYTAIAGTLNATASVFQKIAFNVPVTLAPGRYFLGAQLNGATATPRHVLAANGAEPRCGKIATTTSFAGGLTTFTNAPITVPTSFTTAQAPIMQLYS
jgi:hypothetical protein